MEETAIQNDQLPLLTDPIDTSLVSWAKHCA